MDSPRPVEALDMRPSVEKVIHSSDFLKSMKSLNEKGSYNADSYNQPNDLKHLKYNGMIGSDLSESVSSIRFEKKEDKSNIHDAVDRVLLVKSIEKPSVDSSNDLERNIDNYFISKKIDENF